MATKKTFTKILFDSPSILSGEEAEIKKSDFDFEKKLGDGAFGHVWKVRHKVTRETYALKQVAKEKVVKMQAQFRREVYIMYNLNHPHIAKLFNHFEDEKSFYLILEFAESGNLFHRLHRQKQFMECEAAQYFREVLLAVDYLHSHVPAIIHRDIKPENILLDKDNRVKLTDFGWSNYYSDEVEPRTTICGTPEYLPPEMVEQKTHDTSADIWCLGVLLYEMLVGHTPFKSQAKKNMLINISMCKPKFPLSFPPQARDLISRMLVKNTAERLKIKEIQEHPWLLTIPEMKETVRQKIFPIPLPQYHGILYLESIPVNFKCYKVMGEVKKEIKELGETKSSNNTADQKSCKGGSSASNFSLSDSELSLSDSELSKEIIEDIAGRESIRVLMGNIEEKQAGIKQSKKNMRDVDKELRDAGDIVKHIQGLIQGTMRKHEKIEVNEKILHSKIADLDLEINELFVFADEEKYASKMHQMRKGLMENTGVQGVFKRKIEILKEKFKEHELKNNEKTSELNELKDQLTELKQKYSEKIEVLDWKNQKFSKSKTTRNLELSKNSSEENYYDLKKEILKRSSKALNSEAGSFDFGIRKQLKEIHAKISNAEVRLTDVKKNYEARRYEIFEKSKTRKEELISLIKCNNDVVYSTFYKTMSESKENLRQELKQARELEHCFPFNSLEFDRTYQRFLVISI